MIVRFMVNTGYLLVILLLLPVSRLAGQEGEPLERGFIVLNTGAPIEPITLGTPTPITIPITPSPTPTVTVTFTPTVESHGAPVRLEREAALSSLEEIGLTAMTQSAAEVAGNLSLIVIDSTPIPSPTPTASPIPSLARSNSEIAPAEIPILELANVEISENVFTTGRPAGDAGRDATILLVISAFVLTVWYLWTSNNLKNRDFSKFK